MPPYVESFNQILASGTIVLQIALVVLLLSLIIKPHRTNKLITLIDRYAPESSFIIAAMAVVSSLFYSEVVGFPPCELCWIERAFIYPQVILFGLLIWKKKISRKHILNLSLLLSILGTFVSLYHVYIENGGTSALPCAALQSAQVSCSVRYVYEFGYITIPVMALTTSITILVLIFIHKVISKDRH